MKNSEVTRIWLTLGYSFVSIVILINYLKTPPIDSNYHNTITSFFKTNNPKISEQNKASKQSSNSVTKTNTLSSIPYSYSNTNITQYTNSNNQHQTIDDLMLQLQQQKEINANLRKFIHDLQNAIINNSSYSFLNNFANYSNPSLQNIKNLLSLNDHTSIQESKYSLHNLQSLENLLPPFSTNIDELFKIKTPPPSKQNPFNHNKKSLNSVLKITCDNILNQSSPIFQTLNNQTHLTKPFILLLQNSNQNNQICKPR